jgi:sugar lactone lactonase YvrE
MERKVSYFQLSNFKAVGGTVLPLIDSGLQAPYGIAWDSARSALYVADGGLRKIFRVTVKGVKCERQCKGIEYQLKTTGNQYTIVDGVVSQWVSVDSDGDLYFTDQQTNSVSKVTVDTIQKMIDGKLVASELKRTTEPEMEGLEAAAEAEAPLENTPTSKTVTTTPRPPSIYELYASNACANVGTPAGVVASGSQLYWTNQVGGFGKGSVSYGKTHPKVKTASGETQKPTFASNKFANNTGSAYGITITDTSILYTDSSHNVWMASKGSGNVVALSKAMLKPRGIIWDGDNTAYVADEEGNFIKSMPVGLLKENAPVAHCVDFHAPFGIALMNNDDPIWDRFKVNRNGATGVAQVSLLVMAFVSFSEVLMMF